ncbi:TPA: acyl carrier protein [Clostridioides difficile]|uniref:phosphopantetheine-binding protein n=1 Tax=Clostridioides difficile TaxID=1496 RepID=UPI00038C7388|nr:phosphopantetheine-binding protein [Clostridioides difficile]EGT4625346.1 acyl carrier protein [Clostridioides difficile]ELX4576137.1 acyl carrier protein [Clostridioides difficile]EQK76144.1 phosphopantetheine attachment site family protein [Clostridioides difficile CD113]MBH6986767.1 acyl carrier protein [Clostridioides difficile]MBH7139346.1 acyl carrier protein [Clostridioides difficile]
MSKAEIKKVIKEKILIDRLELEDITPDEIIDDEPLFGEGLGLDSVEALDVAAGVKEEFNVELPKMSQEETYKHFFSVDSLTAFVETLL